MILQLVHENMRIIAKPVAPTTVYTLNDVDAELGIGSLVGGAM